MAKPDFSQAYEDNRKNVWNLISRFVFTVQDREDLFQEVFLNIHKGLKGFRADSSLATWIYRVASNTAINFVNKKNRYRAIIDLLHLERHVEAEKEQEAGNLEELLPLKKLNPKQRMILLLSDVEERKLEEIAEIMGLALGTVKSNLFRAREIIRKEVVKNGGI